MLLDIVLLLAGALLLYFGAEWLVHGSAGLARSFGVKPIVIGLTVVAYGTSAPELVVSVVAATGGRSAIVLGNVLGSNIANIGLILGLTTVIRSPRVDGGLIRRELPVMIAASLLVPLMLYNGVLSRLEGAFLVASAVGFTLFTLRLARQVPPESTIGVEVREEVAHEAASGGKAKLIGIGLLGLGALAGGGKVFVDAASDLALRLGMSEQLVGMTIVALGTSLPELATSVVAALRGHSDLAVGNVIGSNIFNILWVLGGAAVVRPISESLAANSVGLAVMIGFAALGALMMRGEREISRAEGAVLVVAYGGFLAVLGT